MLPDQPPTFRSAGPTERPWWWRLEDTAGTEVAVRGDLRRPAVPQPGRRRVVGGETWADLAHHGVDQVTLFELERQVYGPMSLHA